MVGVPPALHLAAGLLAVSAAVGLALALLSGRGAAAGADARLRLLAGLGALAYAVGAALAGAQLGDPALRTWVQAGGLLAIAVGTTRGAASGLALVVPVVPTTPAYAAAAAGLLAAARVAAGGRGAVLLALGLAVTAGGHALEPDRALEADLAFAAGALLVGAWLWRASRRRILAKLLTAFAAALLALATVLAAVLSTASSAELTADELARLGRLAEQLTADVASWPAQAVLAAQPLSRSVNPLVTAPLPPEASADLFDLSLSSQDFYLALDGAGQIVNSHPPSLEGSVRLALTGDPLVAGLLAGGAATEAGGLLGSGDEVLAFGAVALRADGDRPEAPPAGVLVTGRRVDVLWAAQESAALDVGLVGVVGGRAVFATDAVGLPPQDVVAALGDRDRAALDVGDAGAVFAAVADLRDPERGTTLGQLIATSTPDVIASVEAQQTRRLFVVALLGGALALVLAAVVTRRFVAPIGQLTAVAESIGGGDLSRRAGISSSDEVGVLAATFDDMVESLAEQQQDLTSSAQREARLRGRFESLTTSMGDGLIAVDATGAVITFNPAAEAMTGRTAAEVLDRPLPDVLVGSLLGDDLDGPAELHGASGPDAPDDLDHRPADPLQLRNALDGTTTSARMVLARSDGTRLPVAANAAPVRAPNGEVIGRVYVLRDITTDLQVEQMKTQFLANVSHELRTPITPIKGYANVLARRDVGPEATKRFAQQILDSTKRLERIVGMIVDFAALDSGRVTLRREPVDLRAAVDDRLAGWGEAHADRVFASRLNGGLPRVMADPAYLGRLLDELLDNAVKFSPDGQDVVVAAHDRGDVVELQVIDAGIGIDDEAARRLFSDFVQADGTETRHFGGLGLGLGLVKRIVDGMGAEASVTSAPGEGTTVTLLLPAAPAPAERLPGWGPPAGRAATVPPPPA
jgi:two-component system phosphate regulon sensor histidine kinase PhoR